MSHVGKQKLEEKKRNNRRRVMVSMNTGTRDVGKTRKEMLEQIREAELKEFCEGESNV